MEKKTFKTVGKFNTAGENKSNGLVKTNEAASTAGSINRDCKIYDCPGEDRGYVFEEVK